MSVHSVTYDHDLYPGDLIAAEFVAAALAAEGDTTYGDATAVGDFAEATDGLLSEMLSDALAFWTAGIADAGSSTAVTGLSATTPREYFDCFISDTTSGTGTWKYQDGTASTGTLISAENFALGIRGVSAAGGSTIANAVFDWLMTFDETTTYALPDDEDDYTEQYVLTGLLGPFDPTIAPTTLLKVIDSSRVATAENASAVYSLNSLGILASFYSTRQQAAFAETKATLNDPKAKREEGSERDNDRLYLVLQGECGLSFQPSYTSPVPASRKHMQYAAQTGNIYRYAPKASLGRGNQ